MDELWTAVAEWMHNNNVFADQPRAVRVALEELKAEAKAKTPSATRTKRIILCNIAIRNHDQLFPEYAEEFKTE